MSARPKDRVSAYPSREEVVETARHWDDGVSGLLLCMRLEAQGFLRRLAQRRIQQCLDRGDLVLGRGLRIYPRDSDASLAEDAKRLSPEGVAARAEGIAQGVSHD